MTALSQPCHRYRCSGSELSRLNQLAPRLSHCLTAVRAKKVAQQEGVCYAFVGVSACVGFIPKTLASFGEHSELALATLGQVLEFWSPIVLLCYIAFYKVQHVLKYYTTVRAMHDYVTFTDHESNPAAS